MCAPWDTGCLADTIATAVSNTVLGQISMMITTAEQWLIDTSASWWVLVPSIKLYPNAANTDPGARPIDTVVTLRGLILPITAIVAMGGMLWNGLLMILSRKPAPLVNVLRGLWNTALWSAVGIFGTNLLLYGTDAFSSWVITSALRSVGEPSFGKRLSTLLIPITGAGGLPPGVVILVGGMAMIGSFVQAILMLFRDGSVLILAASTPLAASGSFTNASNGWLRKLVTWQLALIFYKPFAALVYASAIWLQGENTSRDPRVFLMGIAMMLVSLVGLPVLLRFFNWTVGSLQSGGGGLGMLATAGAAGMHAASSLRGGGFGVNEHARYISETLDRGSSPGGGQPGPGPAGLPGGGGGPRPGPGTGPAGGMKPPAFVGQAGAGRVANITSAGGGSAGAASSSAGGAAAGAGAASSGGAAAGAAGAGTGAAMGASAAAGPAAPVVAGAVVVTSAAVNTVKSAANAAASATSDATKGG